MEQIFRLTGEVVSKKNANKFNRKTKMMYKNMNFVRWHQNALVELLPQIKNKGIDYPVFFIFHFVHGDKIRRDSDNGVTSIMDLLVDAGVITDDNWKIGRIFLVINDYEKGNPHCTVTLKDKITEEDFNVMLLQHNISIII